MKEIGDISQKRTEVLIHNSTISFKRNGPQNRLVTEKIAVSICKIRISVTRDNFP